MICSCAPTHLIQWLDHLFTFCRMLITHSYKSGVLEQRNLQGMQDGGPRGPDSNSFSVLFPHMAPVCGRPVCHKNRIFVADVSIFQFFWIRSSRLSIWAPNSSKLMQKSHSYRKYSDEMSVSGCVFPKVFWVSNQKNWADLNHCFRKSPSIPFMPEF